MAKITLGIGTSHTPMLNAPVTDWPKFIELDLHRVHLDKEGNTMNYAELLKLAGPHIPREITGEKFLWKHTKALAALEHLHHVVKKSEIDVLIIVGDDQKELYKDNNMPSILMYRGETIRNVPLKSRPGPEWAKKASAKYYEDEFEKGNDNGNSFRNASQEIITSAARPIRSRPRIGKKIPQPPKLKTTGSPKKQQEESVPLKLSSELEIKARELEKELEVNHFTYLILFYSMLNKGPLYYYDKVMSVYNITGTGIWSKLSKKQQIT
jgi:hypothetical protein